MAVRVGREHSLVTCLSGGVDLGGWHTDSIQGTYRCGLLKCIMLGWDGFS